MFLRPPFLSGWKLNVQLKYHHTAEVLKVGASRNWHRASGQFCQHIGLSKCVTARGILNAIVFQPKVQMWKGWRPQATWNLKQNKTKKPLHMGRKNVIAMGVKTIPLYGRLLSDSYHLKKIFLSIFFLYQSNILQEFRSNFYKWTCYKWACLACWGLEKLTHLSSRH